jgi:23S rRNA pseudouridine1911/1915/1917 synthase
MDEVPDEESLQTLIEILIAPAEAGDRIDRVLAERAGDLSRARLQALIEQGAVCFGETPVRSGSARARAGLYRIELPAAVSATPQAEDIPLTVLYEDAHLIVIDKPAGMVSHPGPGQETGSLVHALLHHCAGSLSGIGGVARPGIVHRLDKDTSGVMVAAKTDAAHHGLSDLFARHDIDRAYIAFTRGALQPPHGTIEGRIGRAPHDRKKMALLKTGGRAAVTHYAVEQSFGPPAAPVAARVRCRLETGRTHQIRVHLASRASPCLGDPVYGSGQPVRSVQAVLAETGLARQALHAAVLGFVHPITGETLRFETPLPADLQRLEAGLRALRG